MKNLLDKSWYRSKKFLAFVVMELFMEGLAVLALLTQPGLGWPLAAFMLGLVVTQGAVAFAFTGQQAALDKYLRGMAKMGIGNLALVVRALNEGVKTYEEARADLENVSEARTDYARLLHNLAFLYFKKGDNAKALELYKKALSVSEPIGDVHISGFTHENMAMMFISMGNLAEAEVSIEKGGRLLARSNDRIGLNLVVWVKGLLKAKKGKLEEAMELYRKAKRGFEDLGMHVQVLNMTDDYAPALKEAGRKKEALNTLAELKVAFAQKDIPELVRRVEEVEELIR